MLTLSLTDASGLPLDVIWQFSATGGLFLKWDPVEGAYETVGVTAESAGETVCWSDQTPAENAMSPVITIEGFDAETIRQNNQLHKGFSYFSIPKSRAYDVLYKFLEKNKVNWKDYLSKKLLPDDSIYVILNNTFYIIECKYQQVAGLWNACRVAQACRFSFCLPLCRVL